jgi:hypothetical protein
LVYLPRSCSQPFGFQRVPHPRLMAPVLQPHFELILFRLVDQVAAGVVE